MSINVSSSCLLNCESPTNQLKWKHAGSGLQNDLGDVRRDGEALPDGQRRPLSVGGSTPVQERVEGPQGVVPDLGLRVWG